MNQHFKGHTKPQSTPADAFIYLPNQACSKDLVDV